MASRLRLGASALGVGRCPRPRAGVRSSGYARAFRTERFFFLCVKRLISGLNLLARSSSSSSSSSSYQIGDFGCSPERRILGELGPCGIERASNSAPFPVISASRKISSSQNCKKLFLVPFFGQGSTLGRGHNGPWRAGAGGMGGGGVLDLT